MNSNKSSIGVPSILIAKKKTIGTINPQTIFKIRLILRPLFPCFKANNVDIITSVSNTQSINPYAGVKVTDYSFGIN